MRRAAAHRQELLSFAVLLCMLFATSEAGPCVNNCTDNGYCVVSGGVFSCVCFEGYAGTDCATCADEYARRGSSCHAQSDPFLPHIDLPTDVSYVVLIVIGIASIILAYAGFRVWKVFVFFSSALLCGLFATGLANQASDDQSVHMGVGLFAALVGGYFALKVYNVGLFLSAAAAAVLIGTLASPALSVWEAFETELWIKVAYYAGLAIIGGIAIRAVTRKYIAAGLSSVVGAYGVVTTVFFFAEDERFLPSNLFGDANYDFASAAVIAVLSLLFVAVLASGFVVQLAYIRHLAGDASARRLARRQSSQQQRAFLARRYERASREADVIMRDVELMRGSLERASSSAASRSSHQSR